MCWAFVSGFVQLHHRSPVKPASHVFDFRMLCKISQGSLVFTRGKEEVKDPGNEVAMEICRACHGRNKCVSNTRPFWALALYINECHPV